ncbi:MAG: cysteine sulfinate desulfinase [Candidatus Muproteobacteria bacterium RBG_16_65_34]|uniref:Cysteine desulfurase n=1 Tax=Candidatus Muproteobacteria bacterium RBG_16_65_34 TaxID=1817760 RepID=A0A1F6TL66_9PROT|nr:MAG: cysteine sulfinate desulfinase [Candidatus Muproteobacteria bacterium RBG_16_65_34]
MSAAREIVARETHSTALDVAQVRADFPVLHQQVRGRPLVYLDNAATTQKPRAVIEALDRYYRHDNANVHRGVHALSARATAAFEGARAKVKSFINARSAREIVFVRGATEAINLVAQSWGRANLKPDDEILLMEHEHHSNIVPWQMLCEQTGARLKVVPIDDAGEVRLDEYERLLTGRVKLVGMTHCSNALGTINPVAQMIRSARAAGARVLVDGAQAAAHLPVDVQALDCDFYVFSGHKLYAPTGIGVLYGKAELLEAMPPYQGGGEMIKVVSFEKSVYTDIPYKFEAGTPHIAGAIGLGAAIDYLKDLGLGAIERHEQDLLAYATRALADVPGVRLIGTARHKAAIVSFALAGVHPHDIGTIVDHEGVAIRVGHHCAMPVMRRFGVPATARASFALYNTRAEVDALVAALHKVKEVFR